MKARCETCGRIVQIVIPAGGDGSVNVYVRHVEDPRAREVVRCKGSRTMVDHEPVDDEIDR